MRMKLLAAAGLALAVSTPALAQMQRQGTEPPVMPPLSTDGQTNPAVGEVLGTGALPGVGMSTTTTTERGGPSGPGGLSGGVGAAGAPVPGLMSGAPDATAPLRGIPFETAPNQPTTVSPN